MVGVAAVVFSSTVCRIHAEGGFLMPVVKTKWFSRSLQGHA